MGLTLKNVSKSFGEKKAVNDVSFSLDKPQVFGLLGTNGAGKTTTIRMILGIIKKDTGSITWNGKDINRKKVNFGYLPEERGVYPKTKIRTQLMYFAELKGMDKASSKESIEKWAKVLKVEEYLEMTAEKLSKGNQQKIQLMTALIHDPDLIVLDEPFSGLDPVNTDIVKKVIIDLVKAGKYVIMSAHEMHTVEEFCSNLIILNKGNIVLEGNLKDIRNSYEANRVIIETEESIDDIVKDMNVENSHDNRYVINIESEKEAHDLLSKIVKAKIKVLNFSIEKPTLNDIFIEKVGEVE